MNDRLGEQQKNSNPKWQFFSQKETSEALCWIFIIAETIVYEVCRATPIGLCKPSAPTRNPLDRRDSQVSSDEKAVIFRWRRESSNAGRERSAKVFVTPVSGKRSVKADRVYTHMCLLKNT